MGSPPPSRAFSLRSLQAWSVHLFTASGAVLGTIALLQIFEGNFRTASLLILANLLIDAVDGTLARKVGVSTVLPHIDGRRLDDMVDFFNYVLVPVVFVVSAGQLLHWAWLCVPILASAYGFSRDDAKTADDFFLGFPSYWNVVVLYAWLLELSALATTVWIVGLSLAVFVPMKFLYPSKMHRLRRTTIVGGYLWGACFTLAILAPELAERFHLVALSLIYMAYYWSFSLWLGGFKRS